MKILKYLLLILALSLFVFAGYFFVFKKNNLNDFKKIFVKKQQIDNSVLVGKSTEIGPNLFGFHAMSAGILDTDPIGAQIRRNILHWEEYEPTKGNYQDQAVEESLAKFANQDKKDIQNVISIELSHKTLGYKGEQENKAGHKLYGYPQDNQAFQAMILHLMEKTNCDGKNDFSFCEKYPEKKVIYWQIGNEWLWQWQGDRNDYVKLLKETRQTILGKDKNAKILIAALTGIEAWTLFDGYIEPEPGNEEEEKYAKYGKLARENKDFIDEIPTSVAKNKAELLEYRARAETMFTTALPYYDIFDVHFYTNDPHRIPSDIKWIQDNIAKNGSKKPIWSLEHAGPFADSITDADLSSQIVQRYILGAASGIESLFWSSYYPTLGWDQRYINTAIVDVKKPSENPKGYEDCTFADKNETKTVKCLKKPAYHTYKLMTEKLGGMTKITQIGNTKDIYVFELTDGTKKVYVAWSVSGKKSFEIDSSKDATVTHIITERNQTSPKVDNLVTKNGKINITLTETPVFVELN